MGLVELFIEHLSLIILALPRFTSNHILMQNNIIKTNN